MGLLRLIDITFHANREYAHPDEILKAQHTSLEYINYIDDAISVTVIKHWRKKAIAQFGKATVYFFTARNLFFYVPFSTLFFVRKQKPDMLIVQGFGSPFQVVLLRWVIGKKAKIVIQHHGEQPSAFPKKILQQWAGRCVDGFLFTAIGNADVWIDHGIIRDKHQCYELLEASVFIQTKPKKESRIKLEIPSDEVFLWVGRLNENKDPITVLHAFSTYLLNNPDSVMYMIYQTEELKESVQALLAAEPNLQRSITMVGYVSHKELPDWYCAADFYISGSHREGSGYALIEAIACGCIPVVTDIPSFRKITAAGNCGFLFEAGNKKSLIDVLAKLKSINREKFSEKLMAHFNKELSFSAIAVKLTDLTWKLCGK